MVACLATGRSLDSSGQENRRIEDIASEVLRLRLVQSQHKQLEDQLRAAAEKLIQLNVDSVFQLRSYLEHGLRPGGGPGTLGGVGGVHGGVDPESLLGLMECLCVVCDVPVATRRHQDLLTATKWLLQDPRSLINRLISLPPAHCEQTRRLAPFLLSCAGEWRGPVSEVGQCYEMLRLWLSSYYQFSLVNSQMEAIRTQLQQQERLIDELSFQPSEGVIGVAGTPSKAHYRPSSGVRRSSSVQSNSSAGSRRSQSRDKEALRPSPRTHLSSPPREGLGASPMKASARPRVAVTAVTETPSRQAISPGRSNSPQLQPSSSRTSLHRSAEKVEASPRAARYTPRSPLTGTLGSARTSARAGAPPPNQSPREKRPNVPGRPRRDAPVSSRPHYSSGESRAKAEALSSRSVKPEPSSARLPGRVPTTRVAKSYAAPPSGRTPARSAMPGTRRLSPSVSATTLRPAEPGAERPVEAWSLSTSRSTPSLDMRMTSRHRETRTPRPLAPQSARAR